MNKTTNGQLNTQLNKVALPKKEKIIVIESYIGVKSLSAILEDLILSEISKTKAG